MDHYDIVVIGGGAADRMHGFLSRDGTPLAELMAASRREVTGDGGEVMRGTVTDLVPDGRHAFWVFLADGPRQGTPGSARQSSQARLTSTHQKELTVTAS